MKHAAFEKKVEGLPDPIYDGAETTGDEEHDVGRQLWMRHHD